MNDNQKIGFGTIFKTLSKPLSTFFSILLALSGVSFASIIFVFRRLQDVEEQLSEITIQTNILIPILFGLIGLIALFMFLIAMIALCALVRLKINYDNACSAIKDISDCMEGELPTSINKLHSMIIQKSMAENILDRGEITRLESSTKNGQRIIVMTSKYELEKDELVQVILDNIRKGVQYDYLVPGQLPQDRNGEVMGQIHEDFCSVIKEWWRRFQQDLFSNEPLDTTKEYSDEYLTLYKSAHEMQHSDREKIRESAREYLREHIKKYIIAEAYGLITVIMYQQEKLKNDWKVIIKLPTDVHDDEYYAFLIPEQEKEEKQTLIHSVKSLCKDPAFIELK